MLSVDVPVPVIGSRSISWEILNDSGAVDCPCSSVRSGECFLVVCPSAELVNGFGIQEGKRDCVRVEVYCSLNVAGKVCEYRSASNLYRLDNSPTPFAALLLATLSALAKVKAEMSGVVHINWIVKESDDA